MTYDIFKNALSADDLNFVSNEVLGPGFPWYYQEYAVPKTSKYHSVIYPFLCHNLMLRAESRGPEPGRVNSDYFSKFYDIFLKNCPQHTFLLRMSLNLTFYHNEDYGDIHVDHDFEHNNMIIYLNKFTNGHTYIFDEDYKKTGTIKSDYNTGCIFPGSFHAQGFCNVGESRLILVATYV